MSVGLLAHVAVHARSFSRPLTPYTYTVPDDLRGLIEPGSLVWVPLRKDRVQGVVLDLEDTSAIASGQQRYAVRPIIDLGDPEVRIPPANLELARWVAAYYRVPLWEAVALLLPPGVGQEARLTWRVTPAGADIELGELPPRERAILFFLRRHGETSEPDLHEALRGSSTVLRRATLELALRDLIMRGRQLTKPHVRVHTRRTARLLIAQDGYAEARAALARAPRRLALLETLIERVAALPDPDAVPAHDLALGQLRHLEARGWIELGSVELLRNPLDGSAVERDMPPTLTERQATVLQPILASIDAREHAVYLLHGVTGSGKTELYLRAIARALRRGCQALVLVPEIALTAQLVRRFAARFGDTVAVLHSELSLGERYDTWRRLRRGEARVVVGSRSAVFAPLPDLGLIVVDEEHEGSYKHADGVRYHARDVAIQLAARTGSTVILGSATPSLESFQATQDGYYHLLELRERVAARPGRGSQTIPLPPVRVVDMRIELRAGNRSLFSRSLQLAIEQTLAAGQQGILFLNRRGVASIVLCRDCGYVVGCVRCSSPLVLHNLQLGQLDAAAPSSGLNTILRCHTCGYRELPPALCPQCWSTRIRHFGVGTQRVVEELNELFPDARVLRWDRDVTGRKGSHERLLDAFTNHEADVIVGTQMIAKGLDLPLVTLVGIVSADIGLHLPDFRSGERTFQLLTQVAGRAGRRNLGGQVILQSYTPEHYALQAAANHDYTAFFREEIAFRRDTDYPPFSQLVRFVYTASTYERAQQAAENLARELQDALDRLRIAGTGIIGPAPAFAERVRDRYRWHLLLRAPDVAPILDALGPLPGWSVDVDPISML